MRYICENNHVFEHTAKRIEVLENLTIEHYVCPHCKTLTYCEYTLDKKSITSVISVDLAEVDAKLAEGYEVESLYAKTATLVKRG